MARKTSKPTDAEILKAMYPDLPDASDFEEQDKQKQQQPTRQRRSQNCRRNWPSCRAN